MSNRSGLPVVTPVNSRNDPSTSAIRPPAAPEGVRRFTQEWKRAGALSDDAGDGARGRQAERGIEAVHAAPPIGLSDAVAGAVGRIGHARRKVDAADESYGA